MLIAVSAASPAAAAPEGGGGRAASFPRAVVRAVLAQAHAVILERHIESASPTELALWSLRGLTILDPRLSADIVQGQLRLVGEDRVLAAASADALAPTTPPEAAAPGLAHALGTLYEAAWRGSATVRRAGIERMLQSGFEELFNHLDPYSRYVTPREARQARERRVGQSGLGLRLAAGTRGAAVIAAITPNGPAATAGLRPGDRLLAVDGVPVSAADLPTAAALIEGPAGTSLVLRVVPATGGRAREVTLVRRLVVPETVLAERHDDILWLRLTGFSSDTDRRLAEALANAFADEAPPRGVVLDLRGNRGGLLNQAVAVADAFLAGGEVVRTEGRHPEANRRYFAGGVDLAAGRPVVVLVDGRTASAAEIVAAALAERQRAVVVGSATMGKGLIQLVAPLPNDGELLVTWSRVLAPSGWPIQGLGLLPSVCTSLGEDGLATTLAKLRGGEPLPMALPQARQRAARAPVPTSEIAALRSACPPAEGRGADQIAALGLIAEPDSYLAALPQP